MARRPRDGLSLTFPGHLWMTTTSSTSGAKTETRRIGLSLAQTPAYEAPWSAWTCRFRCPQACRLRGVGNEPYDRHKPDYDLVIDRLTHWFPMSREWIKKITLMDEVYVFNNPWAIQSMEKHTSYCAMRLGLPVPETWLVLPKQYPEREDLHTRDIGRWSSATTVSSVLGDVGHNVGYPLISTTGRMDRWSRTTPRC